QLFLKVNNINAKKNGAGFKHRKNNKFLPLKGFVICTCGKPLTGYTEKIYKINYYRCNTKGCSGHNRADKLNEKFKELLSSFQIRKKFIAPLKLQMKYIYEYHNESNKDILNALKYNLNTISEKLEKVEERFVYGEINMELYNKHSEKLKLEKEAILKEIENSTIKKSKFDFYIKNTINLASNLLKNWELSGYCDKQALQKLLFPKGIMYDKENNSYRSFEVNPIFALINTLSISYNNVGDNKNFDNSEKFSVVSLGKNLEKFMWF
ncbi:zinc ribbon domain-containing protein, partial [Kordia jejudonensis]|uniref:zinc ribbon domain-containing protein n=1 Tax=Kordia jejudonensis TaxID=1348245 RepID=UPI000629377B